MGTAPLMVGIKTISRGRGLKTSLIVSAGFTELAYLSTPQVPALLFLSFSIPAVISIMLSDVGLYRSAMNALIITGISPRGLKILELTASLIISTIISIPYLIIGVPYLLLAELLALTTSILMMHYFEQSIRC